MTETFDPQQSFEDTPEAEQAAIQRLREKGLLLPVRTSAEVDLEMADAELRSLLTDADREIVNWIPDTPGQKVGGVLKDITDVDADFVEGGTVPMLVIESPTGRLWGVRAYHSVLRNEIKRRLDKNRLKVGDLVVVVYQGKGGEANAARQQYENYRLVVKPQS